MKEQELREKIAKIVASCVLYKGTPVFHWDFYDLAAQILALIKEALPDLAKEAGWFNEEAELYHRLVDRGWIPPAEAKNYVRLAENHTGGKMNVIPKTN